MDEELLEKVNEYSNVTNKLYEYFSNPNRDKSLFEYMLHLYDKYFYILNENMMGSTLARYCEDIIIKFNSIGGLVANCLSQRDEMLDEIVGHRLLQEALDNQTEIIKFPSLLQYYFYERCKSSNIPFQPLESLIAFTKGANTTLDNVVQISRSLGKKFDKVEVRNAFVLYAIEHELQHLSHKFADSSNSKESKLLNLYSRIQFLEDGFEVGNPSHHIGQHAEFPDEVKADYDACRELYYIFVNNYTLPAEEFEEVKIFLKTQSTKLVFNATGKVMSPEEYLDYFVQDRMVNNENLTESEKQKVTVFLEDFQNIQGSQME